MEIFKENKKEKWNHILKKLLKSKLADPKRLESIQNSLDQSQTLVDSDVSYLEQKFNELKQLSSGQSNQYSTANSKYEREIQMIKKLHQKEIGDHSRLESIRNYLVEGQPLIEEDGIYLKKQYHILKSQLENEDYDLKSLESMDPSKPQTILIDDVETQPTQSFTSLSKTIAKIIQDSKPHFTIGIYGEWGTGKTTLMKAIENNLVTGESDHQKVLPVWFNAWKYEREENLATVSLMKTVAYAMDGHDKFNDVSKTILKGLTIIGKDLMQQLSLEVLSKDRVIDNEFDEKMSYLNKLYRDSVYFDGLKKIKQQMEKIREDDPDYRIIIFIDDLDRCSPKKALEVLESIKLFLDIEGFAFVIGLSHNTVTQLISNAYKTTGVKGDDYIKKIIQIPIKIPSWSQDSIIDLIENRITKNLHKEYTKFLSQNSGMIARVVDYNPRQLKRFVNNVIIAFETFANKEDSPEIQFNEIFLAKILKSEYPDFYKELTTNGYFRDIVEWMITKPKDLKKYFKYLQTPTYEEPVEQKNKRISLLNVLSERTNGKIDTRQIDILSDFDYETWIFLDNVQDVLKGIEDWKIINTIMDVVEEFSYELPIGSNKAKAKEKTTA